MHVTDREVICTQPVHRNQVLLCLHILLCVSRARHDKLHIIAIDVYNGYVIA